MRYSGGEAASLREAPLPQTPSPEEQLAFGLERFFGVGSACELGASPISLVVVTAADRAAATCQGLAYCEGGGLSEKGSATSIGAANGRLFRLRKTAMLSRHWRLWLSFPSSRSLPESGWRLS